MFNRERVKWLEAQLLESRERVDARNGHINSIERLVCRFLKVSGLEFTFMNSLAAFLAHVEALELAAAEKAELEKLRGMLKQLRIEIRKEGK